MAYPDPLTAHGSYYEASLPPAPPHPALQGDTRADVVVVGGGFTGLSAALTLAEKGADVVLLEAQSVGAGASGRNGGQLIRGLRWSWRELAATLGYERAAELRRLTDSARDRVIARVERHKIDCALTWGHFALAHRASAFADMCREAEHDARHFGEDQERIVSPEHTTDHLWTYQPHGGVFDPLGGHFQPLAYVRGLADAAHRAGVRIHDFSPAIAIERAHAPVVRTPGGRVHAERLILAADAGMGGIAPHLGRYTVPILNWQVATEPLGRDRAEALIPGNASIADTRFLIRYYRRSADDRLIFAGGERYRQQPPRRLDAFIRPYLADSFPALAREPFAYGWGGTVMVTMNRLPHFGRWGDVLFAHGFSGHGAMTTTLAGELLAEAATGPSPGFDMFAALPSRPFPGGRWLARPAATLGMLAYAVKDRV